MNWASISVIVATFGDRAKWDPLAARALESVAKQTKPPKNYIHCHGDTLAQARNEGAANAQGQWLCFLDADDELDPYYLETMGETIGDQMLMSSHQHWLIRPATLGVYPDGREDDQATVIPERPLLDANFMVIGTLVEKKIFDEVTGFAEWPLYEDWDLWIRCMKAGCGFASSPESIYRIHVNEGSRNMPDRKKQIEVYNQIRRQYV